MPQATILLAPHDMTSAVYFSDAKLVIIRENLDRYTKACTLTVDMADEYAAEEMFDLTNNPYRQDEREEKYGLGRSLSSGDVVDVDGVKYACMSCGWKVL